VVTRPEPDRSEAEAAERDQNQRSDEDRGQNARRADPDAPGNYVDDDTSSEVPEPNEPA
jgi:hypothetical protein